MTLLPTYHGLYPTLISDTKQPVLLLHFPCQLPSPIEGVCCCPRPERLLPIREDQLERVVCQLEEEYKCLLQEKQSLYILSVLIYPHSLLSPAVWSPGRGRHPAAEPQAGQSLLPLESASHSRAAGIWNHSVLPAPAVCPPQGPAWQ